MRFVEIYEAMKPSMYREYVRGWDKSRYEDIFKSGKYKTDKKGFRIFLDIKEEASQGERQYSDTEKIITDHLNSIGYEVDDYIKGLAYKKENPKRKIKIGKILNKSDSTLFIYFQNDPVRQSTKSKFMVVISRHPYDIAGMSTNRGWTSCMRLPDPDAPSKREIDYDEIEFDDHEGFRDHVVELGYYKENNDWFKDGEEEYDEDGNKIPIDYDPEEYHWDSYYHWWLDTEIERRQEELDNEPGEGGEQYEYVASDVKYGTLIAYAVKRDDPDIKNPTCRILIKPFFNIVDPDKVVFGVENRIYGEPMEGFKATVINWANEVNQSKKLSGIFKMHHELYRDGSKENDIKVFAKKEDNLEDFLKDLIDSKHTMSYDTANFVSDHLDHPQMQALIDDPDKFIKLLGRGLAVNDIIKFIDINELSDQSIYDLVVTYKQPNIIKHFKNISEKLLAKIIKDGHYNILGYIRNPSEQLQMIAVKQDVNALLYIYNPTEKVQAYVDKKAKSNYKKMAGKNIVLPHHHGGN